MTLELSMPHSFMPRWRRFLVLCGLLCLVASPAAAQRFAVTTDKLEYTPDESAVVTAMIHASQRTDSLSATIARPNDSVGTRLPIDASLFPQRAQPKFAAPTAPGEYEVRILGGSRVLCKSAMRFQVVQAAPPPPPTAAPAPTPKPSAASEPGSNRIPAILAELAGTWVIEWKDAPYTGAFASVTLRTDYPELFYVNGSTVGTENGKTTYGARGLGSGKATGGRRFEVEWGYRIFGGWHGTSTLELSADRQTVTGTWTYNDQKGSEIWRRQRMKVSQSRLLTEYRPDDPTPLAPRGQIPTIELDPTNLSGLVLEFRGENQWGYHEIRLDDEPGLKFWRAEQICAKGGSYTQGAWGHCESGSPHAVVGHLVWFFVKPEVTSGRRVLHVGDTDVPFEITRKGEGSAIALAFTIRSGASYVTVTQFAQGDEFFIQADFDEKGKPGPPTRTVWLEWEQDQQPMRKAIEVSRDPTKPGRYRSGPLVARPPRTEPAAPDVTS